MAEADAVVSNVEVIMKAAQRGDWRAAAWFLEHKYPNNWARLESVARISDYSLTARISRASWV
ncbi:MAG: hypothetical protein ACXW1Q_04530 [Halobacteriota archaeon]